MTKQFTTSTIIATIITFCLTNNAHGMMQRYLLALAGDTCLITSLGAMVTKEMNADHEKAFLEFGKPSQLSQIRTDAQKIAPYAPLLVPCGTILSAGSRLGIIAKGSGVIGKTGGLFLAGGSIPANIALVTCAYYIRMKQVPDNADFINKAKDKFHEISKQ